MTLTPSRRHTAADLVRWAQLERFDCRLGRSSRIATATGRAIDTIRRFAADVPCYAGVSWGKDSTVLAHLVVRSGADIPLVWVRAEPHANPDCVSVRDAFLAAHPARYDEIRVDSTWTGSEWALRWRGKDWRVSQEDQHPIDVGFAIARERYGDRYLSGIRGAESSGRAMRMRRYGTSTVRTCAPLGWWSALDVFGYLALHDLPVHPVYAMTMGGALERERLRVDALGGETGIGWGRREWERTYYRAESELILHGPGGGRWRA